MALTATIHKVHLSIADMDRFHYQDYSLTLAQHPSETDERVMMRILAFALNAQEHLTFTKGLCVDDEPDIWLKTLTDDIDLWLEVGLPSEERIRKACARSQRVVIYTYGEKTAKPWWQKIESKLTRFKHLTIHHIADSDTLVQLFQRNMHLQISIQDGDIMLSSDKDNLTVSCQTWSN